MVYNVYRYVRAAAYTLLRCVCVYVCVCILRANSFDVKHLALTQKTLGVLVAVSSSRQESYLRRV